MKTQFKILFSVAAFFFGGLAATAQSGTAQSSSTEEVPGDNFSLEGALELFKKSASPQEFEQLLNSPDSKVNNLDLNGDGEIDYIKVTDKTKDNVHDFILTAMVSANESQDVAVIELEKRDDGTAVLQIVGDPDVYGVETIIEPTSEVKVNAGTTTAHTTVNVIAWPSVQYVYGPVYNPWVSPWYWGYYPGWYRPWRPIVWAMWYPYWTPYRSYYGISYRHRIAYGPALYRPYRTTSVFVYNRNYTQINHFRSMSHSYQYNRGGYAHVGHGYDRYNGGNANGYRYANRDTRANHNYNYNNGNDRGSYNNNSGRTRSDYNTRTRTDYNTRTRSDYNNNGNSNTSGNHSRSFDNNRMSQQPNNNGGQSTRPTRSSFDRSTSYNRSSSPSHMRTGPGGGSSGGSRMSGGGHTGGGGSHPSGGGGSHPSGGGGSHGGGGRGGRH